MTTTPTSTPNDTGGTAGAGGTAPNGTPPAQGAAAPAAPGVDLDAIAARISDAVFANLRRAGVLGRRDGKTTTTTPKGKEPATPANPAETAAQERARLRVFDRVMGKANLSERA